MAVIDELIVLLKLDASQFTSEQKAAAESLNKLSATSASEAKTQNRLDKEREAAAKKQAAAAAKAAKEKEREAKRQAANDSARLQSIAKLTLAYLGLNSVVGLVKNITLSDAAVGRFSDNIGIATDRVSAWQHLASQFGSSSEDITNTFNSLARTLYSLHNYTPEGPDVKRLQNLAILGISPEQIYKAKNAEEVIRMIGAALKALPQPQAYQLGLSAGLTPETINLLRAVAGQEDELLAKVTKANREDSALAQERQREWEKTQQAIEGSARTLLEVMTPALVAVLKITSKIADGWKLIFEQIPKVAENIEPAISKVHPTLGIFMKLIDLGLKLTGSGSAAATPNLPPGTTAGFGTGAPGSTKHPTGSAEPEAGSDEEMMALMRANPKMSAAEIKAVLLRGENYGMGHHAGLDRPYRSPDPSTYAANMARSMEWIHGSLSPQSISTSKSDVHIGQLTVTTNATDAPGVASAVSQELQYWSHATNANNGVR